MSLKPNDDRDEADVDKMQPPAQSKDPPLFFFEVLAQGCKEVLIDHNSQVYRLRATRNGKLILNK
jgi:hemin uptake protein HemP